MAEDDLVRRGITSEVDRPIGCAGAGTDVYPISAGAGRNGAAARAGVDRVGAGASRDVDALRLIRQVKRCRPTAHRDVLDVLELVVVRAGEAATDVQRI